jgi:uncharacterized Zn-binding protein involved in type VI secretion
MKQPAAKQGDKIMAIDTHIIVIPGVGPTPMPHPFNGIITGNLSTNVKIMGMPAATQGSTAINVPIHVPAGAGPFQNPPSNKGEISAGSLTVRINGKPAARNGDRALTCNDSPAGLPVNLPVGTVVAVGTVLIG